MTKVYDYIFYRAFDLLRLTGDYDVAWGASHLMSMFFTTLIIRLVLILNFNFQWVELWALSLIFFIAIHILNFFLFLKKDRYISIVKTYSQENSLQAIFGRTSGLALGAILIYSLF